MEILTDYYRFALISKGALAYFLFHCQSSNKHFWISMLCLSLGDTEQKDIISCHQKLTARWRQEGKKWLEYHKFCDTRMYIVNAVKTDLRWKNVGPKKDYQKKWVIKCVFKKKKKKTGMQFEWMVFYTEYKDTFNFLHKSHSPQLLG